MFWLTLIVLPYSIIILIAWINLRKEGTIVSGVESSDNSLPNISVIVAAKNEEANLPELISDLENLSYPTDKLEIIIVDDHSSDSTPTIIKNAQNITYLLSDGKGKKAALSCGLNYSSGEFIITTDADCSVNKDWLRAYAEKFLSENADLIIGQVKPLHHGGLISVLSELEFYSLQAVTGGLALAGRSVMCNGANLGFRKTAVPNYINSVRLGIASGDDMFLLHDIKKTKGKIVWLNNPGGEVKTQLSTILKEFFNQRSRWAGKSIYYKDPDTIIVGLSTLVANLSIIAAVILTVQNPAYWITTLILYTAKTIPELLLLYRYLSKPEKLKLLLLFLPASIIYPFYVLVTLIVSVAIPLKWK